MTEDIKMALAADADYNFMGDCWSMKSMLAELCFHLARRLNAGDSARESLIDRGIELSTVTSKHVKASNRKVKHILAYQAHKDIHKNLLVLANEELAVNRSIIHQQCRKTHYKPQTFNELS